MKSCNECWKGVAESAEQCPHCGQVRPDHGWNGAFHGAMMSSLRLGLQIAFFFGALYGIFALMAT